MRRKVSDTELIFLRKLGFGGTEIAEVRKMNRADVYTRLSKLVRNGYVMPLGHTRWANVCRSHAKKMAQHTDTMLLTQLCENGGYVEGCCIKYGSAVTNRLLRQKRIVKVYVSLKRGAGGYGGRWIQGKIFNKEYVGKTYFLLNNRTLIVRFFLKIMQPQTDSQLKKTTRSFLRNHLSNAELIAVLYNLYGGAISASQVPQSIQVNGFIRPRGKWKQ